jgi:hypothetical protein
MLQLKKDKGNKKNTTVMSQLKKNEKGKNKKIAFSRTRRRWHVE